MFAQVVCRLGLLLILMLLVCESHQSISIGFPISDSFNGQSEEGRVLAGAQAAIQTVNSNGGIAGQTVSLVTFSESAAASSVPTGLAAVISQLCPIQATNRLPGLTYLCRRSFQNSSVDPFLINVFGSFVDEVTALVDFITRVKNLTDVSVVYVNDTIGTTQFKVVKETLEAINLSIFSSAAFLNAADLPQALLAMLNATLSAPQALVLLVRGQLHTVVLEAACNLFPVSTLFFTTSFVDLLAPLTNSSAFVGRLFSARTNPLASNGNGNSALTWSPSLATAFQTALQNSNTGVSSLNDPFVAEGFVLASLLLRMLRHQSVTPLAPQTIQTVSVFDVYGVSFGPFSAGCTQGLHQSWLFQLQPNGFQLFSDFSFRFPPNQCSADPHQDLQKIIVLGQTVALTGGSAEIGTNMRNGVMAAITEQNAQGGIFGRKLVLLTLDDGYEPAPALRNAQEFIRRNVLGMIGAFGTATSAAAAPVSANAGIPFVGHLSGSDAFRIPYQKYYVNIRAGYADEINCMVDYLTRRRFITRFSIMYQDDAYGQAGYIALRKALASIGFRLLSSGKYTRNTLEVGQALEDIRSQALPKVPQAIIVFGVENPTVKFIRLARNVFPPETLYIVPSPAGTDSFRRQMGSAIANILITQVVPLPTDTQNPVVQRYQSALSLYRSDLAPDWSSLEAYLGARLVLSALERVGAAKMDNRANFIDMIYSSSVFPVANLVLGPYSSTCNQGMRQVWMSYIEGNSFKVADDFTFNFSPNCFSDPTTLRPPLILGVTADLSGPLQTMGNSYVCGIMDSVEALNAKGGFNGQMLDVIVLDDRSDPSLARNNTQHLVNTSDAFVVFSATDEVSSIAVANETKLANLPFLGPLSGSMALRKPFQRNVLNFRASINDEILAMATFLTNTYIARISYFYPAATLGSSGGLDHPLNSFCRQLNATVSDALATLQLRSWSTGSTVAEVMSSHSGSGTTSGAQVGSSAPPQAVIVCAPADAIAKFVKAARQQMGTGASALFLVPSIVGQYDLMTALGNEGVSRTNIFMTQVVPYNFNSSVTKTQTLDAINVTSNDPFADYEGQLVVQLMVSAFAAFRGNTFSRQDVVDAFYSLRKFDLGLGFALGPFSDNTCTPPESEDCKCNQGMRQVWLTRLKDTSSPSTVPFEYISVDSSSTSYAFPSCGVIFTPFKTATIAPEGPTINLLPIILPTIGGVLALVAFVAWRMSINYRRMRLLHSNEAIAIRCAEAISRLQLEEVAFLDEIAHPNRIQIAFRHIIVILAGIKKYVPDAVLQRLAQTHEAEEEDEEDVGEDGAYNGGVDKKVPPQQLHTSTSGDHLLEPNQTFRSTSTGRQQPDKALVVEAFSDGASIGVLSPSNRSTRRKGSFASMHSASQRFKTQFRRFSKHTTDSSISSARSAKSAKSPRSDRPRNSKESRLTGSTLAARRGMQKRRVSALFIAFDFEQMTLTEVEDLRDDAVSVVSSHVAAGGGIAHVARAYHALLTIAVPIIKKNGGTLDRVTSSSLVAVWGAYSVRAESAQTACDVAMELSHTLAANPALATARVHFAVSHGVCHVGEIVTDAMAASMVVGESLRKLPMMADPDRQEPLGVKVLCDAKVRDVCQFTHTFRSATVAVQGPRRTVLYTVEGRISKGAMDEWMYELNEQQPSAVSSDPNLDGTNGSGGANGHKQGLHYETAFSMFLHGRDLKSALAEIENHLLERPGDTLGQRLRQEIKHAMETKPVGATSPQSPMFRNAGFALKPVPGKAFVAHTAVEQADNNVFLEEV